LLDSLFLLGGVGLPCFTPSTSIAGASRPHVHNAFIHGYLMNVLLIPCVAVRPLLLAQRWLRLRRMTCCLHRRRNSCWNLVVWSILFEIIGPHIMRGDRLRGDIAPISSAGFSPGFGGRAGWPGLFCPHELYPLAPATIAGWNRSSRKQVATLPRRNFSITSGTPKRPESRAKARPLPRRMTAKLPSAKSPWWTASVPDARRGRAPDLERSRTGLAPAFNCSRGRVDLEAESAVARSRRHAFSSSTVSTVTTGAGS